MTLAELSWAALAVVAVLGVAQSGLAAAALLFYPLGVAAFARAGAGGRLSVGTAVAAFAGGGVRTAFPVVLLRLKDRPYLRQA